MRTLNEMYKKVLEVLESEFKERGRVDGICTSAYCVLEEGEIIFFMNHFQSNKPSETLHAEFYWHESYRKNEMCYWWDLSEDSKFDQRKKFIEHLIKLTTPNGDNK